MNLKDQITTDLTAAMKAGEELKKEVLRMFKAEIMKEEFSGSAKHELTGAEIVKILKRMIKQRKDSIEQFEKGNRAELAAKEKEEITILEKYLPEQMSEDQIAEIVKKKKAELSVDDKSKMGILMGAVMKEVGDSADGAVVKKIVEESFGG
ncbi:MAG: GatB/YqeY domain-containing protein [Patescibacteria group bacterium]